MPSRIDPKTDWRPVNIVESGASILKKLPERKIWECLLATLPNGGSLGDDAIAAFSVVQEAFVVFLKARVDQQGRPRAATVKANLRRVAEAIEEVLASVKTLDLRSQDLLRSAAGKKVLDPKDYNLAPLNETPGLGDAFTRGHSRLRLLRAAIVDMQTWTADALQLAPAKDERNVDEPGLLYFTQRMAYVWEFYGGERFNASTKRGGGADFVHGLLAAASVNLTRHMVTKAARDVLQELDREQPDRIVVPRRDRDLPLVELLRRGPLPKKRRQSAKR